MTDENGLIDSEEEYNKELANFMDELKRINNPFKVIRDPQGAYNHFMLTIDRAERIGLFDKEYCNEMRMKLVNGLKDKSLKEKIKSQLRKKGFIK